MGSHSYSETCPKCGEEMDCTTETKTPYSSGECLNCGYYFYTKEEQYTLEELNERRLDQELPPLTELPKIVV